MKNPLYSLIFLLNIGFAQNLNQVQNIFTSPNNYPARAVAFSPDGSLLALALWDKAHSIKILEADSGREIATLIGHTSWVNSVAFSPDGNFLASGSYNNIMRIWHTNDFSLLTSLKEHTGSITSIAFSPDGNFLASGSLDSTVKIWDAADFSLLTSLEEHTGGVTSVAFSPAGDFLASGSSAVKIWRTTDFSLLTSLEEHTGGVTSVAFSPAGDFLASGSSAVKIWRTTDFSLLTSLEEHTGSVYSVAFSPAGDFLASGSNDNTVKIWHVNDSHFPLKAVAVTNGSDDWITFGLVAFHPVGTSLVFSNLRYFKNNWGGVVSLWDTSRGQAIFCPSGTCSKPKFRIIFPTPNQRIKGDFLALQLEANNAPAVRYGIYANGIPLHTLFEEQPNYYDAPNPNMHTLVNIEVRVLPDMQGRNIILEVHASNALGQSRKYVPIYVVPDAP